MACLSVSLVRGHTCCPARVARCFRGVACPYMLRGRCWFLHEEVLSCDVAATAVGDDQHVPPERVQNRDGEQTVAVPVPQIMEAIGEVTQRAHSRVVEQIVDLAAPLILEKILSACSSGVHQGPHRGAYRERACAPDQGGHRAHSRR